jgi:hypothetical protein
MSTQMQASTLRRGVGAPIRNPLGGPLTFKLRGEASNGAMMVLESEVPPGDLAERRQQALALSGGDRASRARAVLRPPCQAARGGREPGLVSCAGPGGRHDRGRAAARPVASDTRASPPGFEQVSKYVTSELGYIVEIEHYQAKVGGSEEVIPVSLRCTTVFRREADGWKIVHRHADPITTPRIAESVAQSAGLSLR